MKLRPEKLWTYETFQNVKSIIHWIAFNYFPPQMLQMSTQTARLKAAAGYFILAVFLVSGWTGWFRVTQCQRPPAIVPLVLNHISSFHNFIFLSRKKKLSAEARFGHFLLFMSPYLSASRCECLSWLTAVVLASLPWSYGRDLLHLPAPGRCSARCPQ